MEAISPPLLQVEDLTVEYRPLSIGATESRTVQALRDVSFEQAAGEVLGVLGESGSGKSTLGLALPGLLPPGGTVTAGTVRFLGQATTGAPERVLQRLRGARIGCILQHSGEALHPLRRVGHQVMEVLRTHSPADSKSLAETAARRLAEVGLEDPDLFRAFPSQLSGGQRQRAFVAQALACRPELVVADEPTASLDSIHRLQIAELLRRLARGETPRGGRGSAVLFISHQPDLLASIADRVLVLYRGRRVEIGTADEVLRAPRHPYTAALLACLPGRVSSARSRSRLPTLPDPGLEATEQGCPYAPRCSRRRPICDREHPGRQRLSATRSVACHDPLP